LKKRDPEYDKMKVDRVGEYMGREGREIEKVKYA
jgi:hypothetical protein